MFYRSQNRVFRLFSIKVEKLPSIAESIKDVTISKYLKNEGDFVELDEEILEVETHKGNFKVRSATSGSLKKFLVALDTDVPIGTDYVQIDSDVKKVENKKNNTKVLEK